MELITTSPNDNPSVTFNYFKDAEDLRMCVEGMKTIIDVVNSNAFSSFRYQHVCTSSNRPKDANAAFSLEQYCIDTVRIWHYHGGCQSGRVVDHNYKIIGEESLR
ncbi:hypothetical protein RJT34_25070 [Clitoria ternatea]|uniref:Glucose-methanol-choline oxidoreductase C-terminal domain-containing protein n=1 Tax=Clitoria ternatea TaxID=43366 RepID=A0AAN9FXD9_CLITE